MSEDALSQMNTTESYLLFAHELGHVAGLAHDGRENTLPKRGPIITINPVVSIMTPNVTAHANRLQRGLLLPVLSYKDEDALEARYCR